jgi:hypothetical protein
MKSPQGAYRLVTAYHCNSMSSTSSSFNTFKIGGSTAGINVGKSINGWKAPYDFMLIWNASYGSSIYTGAWNSSTSAAVTGSEAAVLNAPICLSGGFSGVICGQPVKSVADTVTYAAPVGKITPLIRTDDPNGVAAAGEGDSGAPTYVTATSGVHVVSMIQGMQLGTFAAPCRGAPQNPLGRTCSKRIWSESAKLIESKFGWSTG